MDADSRYLTGIEDAWLESGDGGVFDPSQRLQMKFV